MKCQCCQEREATMHLNDIEEWKTTDIVHFCFECAGYVMPQIFGAKGPTASAETILTKAQKLQGSVSGKSDMDLDDDDDPLKLLSEEDSLLPKLSCDACGLDFTAFQKTGRLGCPECYDSFESLLSPALERIHGMGNISHVGRKPGDARPSRKMAAIRRVSDLKNELERMVSAENYERAAELRDEIERLEVETQAESQA